MFHPVGQFRDGVDEAASFGSGGTDGWLSVLLAGGEPEGLCGQIRLLPANDYGCLNSPACARDATTAHVAAFAFHSVAAVRRSPTRQGSDGEFV